MKRKENIKANVFNKKLKYSLNILREYFILFRLKNKTIIYNIL